MWISGFGGRRRALVRPRQRGGIATGSDGSTGYLGFVLIEHWGDIEQVTSKLKAGLRASPATHDVRMPAPYGALASAARVLPRFTSGFT